jgi:hypothetical protein
MYIYIFKYMLLGQNPYLEFKKKVTDEEIRNAEKKLNLDLKTNRFVHMYKYLCIYIYISIFIDI